MNLALPVSLRCTTCRPHNNCIITILFTYTSTLIMIPQLLLLYPSVTQLSGGHTTLVISFHIYIHVQKYPISHGPILHVAALFNVLLLYVDAWLHPSPQRNISPHYVRVHICWWRSTSNIELQVGGCFFFTEGGKNPLRMLHTPLKGNGLGFFFFFHYRSPVIHVCVLKKVPLNVNGLVWGPEVPCGVCHSTPLLRNADFR